MAIFLGILTGVLSFVPLLISLNATKKVSKTSNFGYGAILILGVVASTAILIIAVLISYFFARDSIVELVLSAAVSLSVFAIIVGAYTVIKRNIADKNRANKFKKDEKAE